MRRRGAAVCILVAALASTTAVAGDAVTTVIADFDNHDTSGESGDRTAAHAALVRGFADLLRDDLVAADGGGARRLTCDQPSCSADGMTAGALIGAARRDGARLLVYGGIHKMSTLVQMGRVQVVDLVRDALVLDRSFSFRGDDATAFRRAARFVAGYVRDVAPRP